MTVEPPEARDPDQVPPASPEGTPDGPLSMAWVRRLALGAALLVGGAVAAALLLPGEGSAPSPATEPERGVVCPYLQDAAEELEAGDKTAFVEAVKIAAREGELALERSGQLFGRPEELALELRRSSSAPGTPARDPGVDRLMSEIRAACGELDRWE